jgi:hypothetical protein
LAIKSYLLRQIISADVDGVAAEALAFDTEVFFDPVEAEEGLKLGDGSEPTEGEDGGFDLFSSSSEETFLFFAMASRAPPAEVQWRVTIDN